MEHKMVLIKLPDKMAVPRREASRVIELLNDYLLEITGETDDYMTLRECSYEMTTINKIAVSDEELSEIIREESDQRGMA